MKDIVTGIVEEVLQRGDLDPDRDLFDQGATSLAIVRILVLVNERFRTSLNGSELIDGASITHLVEVVSVTSDTVASASRRTA